MTNVERPIYSNFSSTNRSLCGDSIENMKVLSKIDGIKIVLDIKDLVVPDPIDKELIKVDGVKIILDIKDLLDQNTLDKEFIKKNFKVLNHLKTTCLKLCDATLLDKEYPSIKDPDELRRLMSEVLIRFDTSPSNYMLDDYFALLKVVLSLFNFIADPILSLTTDTPELITVVKDKTKATINLNVAQNLDDNSITENKKVATVELIRNFINRKLEWKII